VSISGATVKFYAFRLVLEASGRALLDDGVLHVSADHITLDLHSKRYMAIGDVTIAPSDAVAPPGARTPAHGDIFGKDLDSQRGLLVALDATPVRHVVEGGAIEGEPKPGLPPSEPLSPPDVGGEAPFATAARAVAHLGADVRLTDARVIVPGSKSVPVPSYVYTYSSDAGYVVSNLGTIEDVPLYFGSTRNSVQGIHFLYRPDIKFGFGLDERIVDGQRGYLLASLSPVFGPSKLFNATWQEQINQHTQQTLTSSSFEGLGTTNQYDLRDGIHHSFVELAAFQFHQSYAGTLAWQGYDTPFAKTGAFSQLIFHLRTEYGVGHTPPEFGFPPLPTDVFLPQTVQRVALEGYVATQPLALGPATTMYASADDRFSHDTTPHLQTTQVYGLTLTQRVNRFVTLSGSVFDTPIHDGYPTVNQSFASHLDTETATFNYNHGRAFALLLTGTHQTASTQLPGGLLVEPWVTSADVRFRLGPSIAIELGRSYYFGFEGQRFGTYTFQIFP
jgi:hypothetical protein